MKQYICAICGYVHDEAKDGRWEDLPDDWKCPICGADKGAFKVKEESSPAKLESSTDQEKSSAAIADTPEKPDIEQELSPMDMSIICSNLARGCEKQYMPEQSEGFKKLAEFFRNKVTPVNDANTAKLLALIENDLSTSYPYSNTIASEQSDRGAMRCLVWSEKVTRMLQSLLMRYEAEGDKMLENTGVYVCTVCGFVFVGDAPPELCPVCKVPAWKFEKTERRLSK